MNSKKTNYFILVFTLVFAFLLRFYSLGDVPSGLYQDETSIGYSAYSIAKTGKDEYSKTFPLYFKSFGDWKLPIYIYATVPAIKMFGLTAFAVRLPSAVFGFLTVPLLYFFLKKLTENNRLALTATFLLAINPWHIHYNRATFEVSISLFLFLLGALLLIISVKEKKQWAFVFGTLSFVLGLYTYNLTRLLAPILYFGIILFFKQSTKKNIRKTTFITSSVIAIITLVPFVFTLLSDGGVASAGGTLIHSSAVVQAKLIEFRSYLVDSPQVFAKTFFNIPLLTLFEYVKHITSYSDAEFFFISGSQHGNHGIGNVGQFYIIELITVVLGAAIAFTKKLRWVLFLGAWALSTVLVASLTREAPHATRSFFLIVPIVTFSAYGFLKIFEFAKKQNQLIRYSTVSIVSLILAYNTLYYLTSYYKIFPKSYAREWRQQDKDIAEYLEENYNKHENIIIDDSAGLIYSSIVFYTEFPPQEFQNTVARQPDDNEGFSKIDSFGKYQYRQIDWEQDLKKPTTLIVSKQENIPQNIKIEKEFFYPETPEVYAVSQEIKQQPVIRSAYVVVKAQ